MARDLLCVGFVKITENIVPSKAKGVSAPALASVGGTARRVLRVWVVDDNTALSELLSQLLSKQSGLRCNRQFPSVAAVMATLAEERPPDIILLDINPGGQNGLAAIRSMRKLAPSVRVLMMTMFSNGYYEAEAFREGAAGFLLKSYELPEIVKLIQAAYHNPDEPALFPNMALRKEFDLGLGLENAGTRGTGGRFGLIRGLRQLYRVTRGEAVS